MMKKKQILLALLFTGCAFSGYAESWSQELLSDPFDGRPIGVLAADGGWTAVEPPALANYRNVEVMTDSSNLMGEGTGNQILYFENIATKPVLWQTELTADGLSASTTLKLSFDFYETSTQVGGVSFYLGGDTRATNAVNSFTLTDGAVGPSGSYTLNAPHHLDAIFNEAGATLDYDDPAGGSSSLAMGRMDIWIDHVRVAAGVVQGRSASPSPTMTSLFITSDGTKQKLYLDNISISNTSFNPPAVPLITSFTADPAEVASGGSVTLAWSTTNADTLSIDSGIGDVTGMTSTQVVVTADTTYSLIAVNAQGSTTSSVPVTLSPPEITSFTANNNSVTNGQTVWLSWKVAHADQIEIDQGIGAVAGTGTTSVVVSPPTRFTLTATSDGGTSTSRIQIATTPDRPNIIFFLVDDMGSQDTSVPFYYDTNGDAVVTALNNLYRTPNMEVLAAGGMKFTCAYAHSVCSPTRVSFMTGMNSARHHVTSFLTDDGGDGAPDWRLEGVDATDILLPQLLQTNGYRTIHCGKGHMGDVELSWGGQLSNLGFDVNIAGNFIGHPGDYLNAYGAGGTRAVPGLDGTTSPVTINYHNSGIFLTEVLTREVNKAIEDAVTNGVPFFTYMSHYAVHSPYTVDPRFEDNYPTLTPGTFAFKFATMLEGMDKSLGDIMAKVNALGAGEDTLIIFMGDNGSTLNNDVPPLRGKKGSKYEGGSRVPLLVGWVNPNGASPFQDALPIPTGSVEDDLVTIFDMFPTILETAGVSFGHPIDGYNLRPYLTGTPGTHRPRELTLNFPHDRTTSEYFSTHRLGDWKLVYTYDRTTATGSSELYNLATDPGELTDLTASEPERSMSMTRDMILKLDGLDAQYIIAENLNPLPPTIPYLPAVDVDKDGIPDNTEDPNSNGFVDPGETNPDRFPSEWEHDGNGDFSALWSSTPGAVYAIRTTDDLTNWTNPPIAIDIQASSPGITTSYMVPANGDPLRFYRIELQPPGMSRSR